MIETIKRPLAKKLDFFEHAKIMCDKKKEHREADRPADENDSSWAQDIKERSYYYDDSTGYEIYHPGEDDEEEKDE